MLLFARMPYCDTSLRDIAAAAEVDVAYVHRSFGSKAEIFRHALAALDPLDGLCCTNRVRDSSRESSVLVANHEQTDTPRLQDPQLAGL